MLCHFLSILFSPIVVIQNRKKEVYISIFSSVYYTISLKLVMVVYFKQFH